MAGRIRTAITGKGVIGELFQYSVTEESTPLNPADSSGSVGALTLSAPENPDAEYAVSETFTLTDPARGSVQGIVRGVATAGGRNTFTADSALGALNTDRLMPPLWGMLSDVFASMLATCGVTGTVMTAADRYVAYPGWSGNVWEHVKMMNAATGTETALVDGVVTLRQPGTRSMDLLSLVTIGKNVSSAGAAQTVEVNNWRTTLATESPRIAFEAESAYNVASGETNVFRIQIDASLSSVNNPIHYASFFDYNKRLPGEGGYTISGSSGLPVPVKWWSDFGGSLTVKLTENPYEVEVTIVAPLTD